jgi:hypothetical protein
LLATSSPTDHHISAHAPRHFRMFRRVSARPRATLQRGSEQPMVGDLKSAQRVGEEDL